MFRDICKAALYSLRNGFFRIVRHSIISVRPRSRLCQACMVTVFLFCLCYIILHGSSPPQTFTVQEAPLADVRFSSHWVVVTSINKPSDALKKLANLSGWQLVVVADEKTPVSDYGDFPVLTVDRQLRLSYKILKYLPWNSYTRKMIGYLYAVEHGAEFIYETDDDNLLESNMTFDLPSSSSYNLVVSTTNLTFNPYPHFGQASVWPRGYPLDAVGLPVTSQYRLCRSRTPAVQQALVQGDPDVDAVFRLTRKLSTKELDIRFDPRAPAVTLPVGTFAPYNSQATLFRKEAFWSLFLPISVSTRVCDIHRAYWAQTLLWLTGHRLSFVAPSSVQRRNPHSLIEDLRAERVLNEDTADLLTALRKWKCSYDVIIPCIRELTAYLVQLKHWTSRDLEALDAWLDDLNRIGYTAPALERSAGHVGCRNDGVPVMFHPEPQKTSMPHTSVYNFVPETDDTLAKKIKAKERKSTIQLPSVFSKNVTLLVVVSNLTDIPLWEMLYGSIFPCRVYCSYVPASSLVHRLSVTYVQVRGVKSLTATCSETVMHMRYVTAGLFVTAGLNSFKHLGLLDLDKRKLWVSQMPTYTSSSRHGRKNECLKRFVDFESKLQSGGVPIFYLPRSLYSRFFRQKKNVSIIAKHADVFCAFLVPH